LNYLFLPWDCDIIEATNVGRWNSMLTYLAIELVLLFILKRLRKPFMTIVALAAVAARSYSQTTQLHYYDPPGTIELIYEIIHAIANVGILILACRISATACDPAFPPFEAISLLSILALNPYLASISDIQSFTKDTSFVPSPANLHWGIAKHSL
jgi:hypothetical protein